MAAIITPVVQTFTITYIKFGSAPSSDDDYDAYASSPYGIVRKTAGGELELGSTTYTNQTIVYVWGTSSYAGQIKINGTLYIGGWTYDGAISYNLTGNYDIELGMGNTTGSGGTND